MFYSNFSSRQVTYYNLNEGMIFMRKMDEMEMSICLKAIKWAWTYTILFLAIWVIYDYIQTRTFGLSFFLLITQNLVLITIQYFLKWKLGKDEK